MYVLNNNTMPDLKTDPNIPPARREDKTAAVAATPSHDAKGYHIDHPYDNIPPFLYRIFMDDSGPASMTLDNLKPGYVYELKLGNIVTTKGEPLANKLICYTLNNLIP